MNINNIGENIKRIRIMKHLTAQQLAELANIDSASTISHIENNGKNFSFDTLIKILNALEITFSECLSAKSEKQILMEKIKFELISHFDELEQEFLSNVIFTIKNLEGSKNG